MIAFLRPRPSMLYAALQKSATHAWHQFFHYSGSHCSDTHAHSRSATSNGTVVVERVIEVHTPAASLTGVPAVRGQPRVPVPRPCLRTLSAASHYLTARPPERGSDTRTTSGSSLGFQFRGFGEFRNKIDYFCLGPGPIY